MAIPFNRTREHSPDVAEAKIFSKLKNTSLRIGSANGEMLMEFIIKNKIKSNFSANL